MKKSTKIVATVSDMRCEIPFIKSIVDEGVNVVRLNSAHMDHAGFDRVIDNTRAVSKHVALLMDTKGPEIRTTKAEAPITFVTGDKVAIVAAPERLTTPDCIAVNYPDFVHDVPVGALILFDDGLIELKVYEKEPDRLLCAVQNDGVLGSRKSVNVPGVQIKMPSLTERDKDTILYCINKEVDFIAHSFVRSKQDVLDIQQILDKHGSPIKIIAKIENQEGVDNIDEIIDASYGVMVARGDLGIEIAQEKIPAIQSAIIRKCIQRKKPVIVATQMLHTMITSPRPTRAEVSDVATAILACTDAVMLSGETAYGKYPIEAVRTMSRIIHEAEKNRVSVSHLIPEEEQMDVTSFLAKQAVKSVDRLGVKAIVTDSFTGRTARYLSAYRGDAPVYAICYNDKVGRQLALSYGVCTIHQDKVQNSRAYYIKALKTLVANRLIGREEMIAYIGGSLAHKLGTTMLELNRASDAIDFFEEGGERS